MLVGNKSEIQTALHASDSSMLMQWLEVACRSIEGGSKILQRACKVKVKRCRGDDDDRYAYVHAARHHAVVFLLRVNDASEKQASLYMTQCVCHLGVGVQRCELCCVNVSCTLQTVHPAP